VWVYQFIYAPPQVEVLSSTYTCTYTCTAIVKDTYGTHNLNFRYKEPVEPLSNPDSDTIVGSWEEYGDCLDWAQSNHTCEFGYHTVTQNLKAMGLWILSQCAQPSLL